MILKRYASLTFACRNRNAPHTIARFWCSLYTFFLLICMLRVCFLVLREKLYLYTYDRIPALSLSVRFKSEQARRSKRSAARLEANVCLLCVCLCAWVFVYERYILGEKISEEMRNISPRWVARNIFLYLKKIGFGQGGAIFFLKPFCFSRKQRSVPFKQKKSEPSEYVVTVSTEYA